MGATVVDTSVNTGNWSKQKPEGYDSKDFDKAIKAYESLNAKAPSVPAALPTMPAQSVKEYEACMKTLDSATSDMKKAVTFMKQLCDALKTVSSTATKTAADLTKQAKDKAGPDKIKYVSAASAATGIGAQATAIAKKLE
jgi:hypothetical protein